MKMKRLAAYAVAALLLLGLFGAEKVRADLIWEPYGNDFFAQHKSEMERLGRNGNGYEINAPGGETAVYKSPVSTASVGVLKNGTHVLGTYSWTAKDGTVWIIIDHTPDEGGDIEGWVPEAYLWRIYDAGLFAEDYRDEIRDESGTLRIPKGTEEIRIYPYPGYPAEYDSLMVSEGLETVTYDGVFTDSKGYRWGRVAFYHMGSHNGWINLDAPGKTSAELYPEGCPVYDKRVNPEGVRPAPTPEPVTPKPDRTLLYAGIGVGAAALASAAVLLLMKKKNAKPASGEAE